MSGTSIDGVDVAAADLYLDGEVLFCRLLGLSSSRFPDDVAAALRTVLPPARTDVGRICLLHCRLGEIYADAFSAARSAVAEGAADLAVLHGQTVFHGVGEDGRALGSLPLGNPHVVAERTGLPVVSDLRARDIAAGGQGAPLVPLFDALWLGESGKRTGVVNLGGIANITVLAPGEAVVGYDIGPAGCLMDPPARWASQGRLSYDADGVVAAGGRTIEPLYSALSEDPYFTRPWPKSTGREHFNEAYLQERIDRCAPRSEPEDVAATVTRLVADRLVEAAGRHGLEEMVLSGGGSRNLTLLSWLRSDLPKTTVLTSEDLGLASQTKEALAFAVLGYLTWHGLPANLPSVTGASGFRLLGSLTPGSEPLRLPIPVGKGPTRLQLLVA